MKKNIYIYVVAFVGVLLANSVVGYAQSSTKTLQQCIDEALENSFSMKSGRKTVDRASALEKTSFNIGMTNVSLSQDPSSGGSPDNGIAVTQDFDFPTVYTSRRKALKAETALERSNLAMTQNELIRTVTTSYYELLFEQQRIAVLKDQNKIYSEFVYLAKTKFELGESSRLELMNAERLYEENQLELQKAKRSYENVQLALQKWMNSDEFVTPFEVELPTLELNHPLSDFNPIETPFGQVFEAKRVIGQRNLALTKQGYIPTFSVTLKSQMLIKGFNPYDIQRDRFTEGNFMGFQVGVNVPLFFREQRFKTKAAKIDFQLAKLKQDEALLYLKNDYKSYENEYYKAKNSLDYFTNKGRTMASEMIRISKLMYEKGEISYIEYIQNLNTSVDISLKHLSAINDYNQTIIMLNYLHGKN